jgi:hypothetical protein
MEATAQRTECVILPVTCHASLSLLPRQLRRLGGLFLVVGMEHRGERRPALAAAVC